MQVLPGGEIRGEFQPLCVWYLFTWKLQFDRGHQMPKLFQGFVHGHRRRYDMPVLRCRGLQ